MMMINNPTQTDSVYSMEFVENYLSGRSKGKDLFYALYYLELLNDFAKQGLLIEESHLKLVVELLSEGAEPQKLAKIFSKLVCLKN